MLDLDIPSDILPHFLPSPNLSICEFLTYSIPTGHDAAAQDGYVSQSLPNATLDNIHFLLKKPAPSTAVIQDLVDCIESSSSTARSLACNNAGSAEVYFPLWIITYIVVCASV